MKSKRNRKPVSRVLFYFSSNGSLNKSRKCSVLEPDCDGVEQKMPLIDAQDIQEYYSEDGDLPHPDSAAAEENAHKTDIPLEMVGPCYKFLYGQHDNSECPVAFQLIPAAWDKEVF